MSTTATSAAPLISGYTTDEQFYATRYRQGGRTVYLVALTPAQIINNIPRPNPAAPNPGNRQIRVNHAQSFAAYYLDHDNWVIPGLILRAPAIFDFTPNVEVADDSASFGVLSYPKRKQGDVQILDGQHRILGFHLAQEMLDENVNKARDHRIRAERTEGKTSRLYKEAQKSLEAAERNRDRFHSERVAIEIQVTDDIQAYRQMFFDIADNALGISASVKARFDKRKVVNRTLDLVSEHPLLLGRVDPENDRLGRTGPYLLSARHITEMIRSVIVGIDGRVGRAMERDLNERDIATKFTAFLDLLLESFEPLQAVEVGSLLPERLRQTSLLGSPLMLRILAGTFHELREQHGFTNEMIRDYFKALSPHMGAPVHENSIWIKHTPDETFNLGAYGPNGRRQDIVNLSNAIWAWAVDRVPFVYSAPEAAPISEADPDERIDFAPGYDAKGVEIEVRNEVEDIAKEAKTSRGRKKS